MTALADQPDLFKTGMRRLAGAVCLVTIDAGGQRQGLIATAVTSLSADPPSLLVCVNETASIFEAMSRAEHFCVNVLSRDQEDVGMRFASPTDREGRFDTGTWRTLTTGAPALEGAQVSFDCRAAAASDFGTHRVFFGEILALTTWTTPLDPLLYHDGAFRALTDIDSREAA